VYVYEREWNPLHVAIHDFQQCLRVALNASHPSVRTTPPPQNHTVSCLLSLSTCLSFC
jgi:hypothetical protein